MLFLSQHFMSSNTLLTSPFVLFLVILNFYLEVMEHRWKKFSSIAFSLSLILIRLILNFFLCELSGPLCDWTFCYNGRIARSILQWFEFSKDGRMLALLVKSIPRMTTLGTGMAVDCDYRTGLNAMTSQAISFLVYNFKLRHWESKGWTQSWSLGVSFNVKVAENDFNMPGVN